jgi:hypothetical protein
MQQGTRRSWLLGAAAACAGAWVPVRAEDPPRENEARAGRDEEQRAVEAIAAKAGLGRLRSSTTGHYLAIGDARDDFRASTLRDCEAVRADFLEHYRAKGFDLVEPEQRLTVVTLADERSFEAFLGKEEYTKNAEFTLEGVYQLGANRLIVFDHRPRGQQPARRAARANRRTLAHEATHQLAYNTRLCNPNGDVPACIGEGLAMYGEVRDPAGGTPPGAINRERLDDLTSLLRQRFGWISLERLIGDDVLVRGSARGLQSLLAYDQSWLLVHFLMNNDFYTNRFCNYLKGIRMRRTAEHRLADARAHLGDLEGLDLELRVYAGRLQKSS